MTWMIDMTLMIIIAIAGYIGYKQGIVKMLVGSLTALLSCGLAYLLSSPLAQLSYDVFFKASIDASIEAAFENKTVETAHQAIQSLIGPDSALTGMAGWLGFDTQSLVTGNSINELATAVRNDIIMPAMTLMLQILIFTLLLLLCLLLFGIIAGAICRSIKNSSIKGANAVFGALVGVLIGVAFAVGICFVLNLWMEGVNPNGFLGIDQAVRGNSVIYLLIHNTIFSL